MLFLCTSAKGKKIQLQRERNEFSLWKTPNKLSPYVDNNSRFKMHSLLVQNASATR